MLKTVLISYLSFYCTSVGLLIIAALLTFYKNGTLGGSAEGIYLTVFYLLFCAVVAVGAMGVGNMVINGSLTVGTSLIASIITLVVVVALSITRVVALGSVLSYLVIFSLVPLATQLIANWISRSWRDR
jgi:hypothetical protein